MASITLFWAANPPTDNVTAYKIFGADGTGVVFASTALLATVGGLTWMDGSLPNNQARTYYIVAENAIGDSAPGGPLNITTGAPSTVYVQNAGGALSVEEDVHASRPAAGTVGRIYVETDTKTIWRDNGVSWDQIGSGGGVEGFAINTTNLFADREELGSTYFDTDVTFPSVYDTTRVTCELPAASNASCLIFERNGAVETQVGTIDFLAGSDTGTVTWSPTSPYTLLAGRRIKIYAPTPRDAALSFVTGYVPGDPS